MFKKTSRLIAVAAVLLVMSGCALQADAGKNLPNVEYRNHTAAGDAGKTLSNVEFRDHAVAPAN